MNLGLGRPSGTSCAPQVHPWEPHCHRDNSLQKPGSGREAVSTQPSGRPASGFYVQAGTLGFHKPASGFETWSLSQHYSIHFFFFFVTNKTMFRPNIHALKNSIVLRSPVNGSVFLQNRCCVLGLIQTKPFLRGQV